jgi:hypothetical protein
MHANSSRLLGLTHPLIKFLLIAHDASMHETNTSLLLPPRSPRLLKIITPTRF